MAKPADAVEPILRNIQKDLSDVKKTLARLEAKVDSNTDRMDAFEGYFTFQMGLTSRNQSDIKRLHGELRALNDRVDSLEPQS